MRKERKIINTNIRLNLCDEQDRQAWEYLQTMDREKYKSYTRAVVVALNDYFSREYRSISGNQRKGRCVSGKGGNSYSGWSKRIRPDGYGEEPA